MCRPVPCSARLDDRELKLQKLDLEGKLGETRRQIDEAIGIRDVAKANILTARREAFQAELAVVADNLTRTALTAPFDGYVVSGDKTQSIGAPVHRGEVAYEISPLDGFRVEICDPAERFRRGPDRPERSASAVFAALRELPGPDHPHHAGRDGA